MWTSTMLRMRAIAMCAHNLYSANQSCRHTYFDQTRTYKNMFHIDYSMNYYIIHNSEESARSADDASRKGLLIAIL